jgi:LemA protein
MALEGVCGLSLMVVLVVAGAVVLLPLLLIILIYNGLISKRNQVSNTFATIDVMLKKRYDLIPNLVSTVEGYATHEREVFKNVTELRAKAMTGNLSENDKIDVNNQLTAALKTIFAVSENYPDLKANQNFLHLQATLTELEEQISAARRAFNASVLEFNNAVQMFPTSIIASAMGLKTRSFFEALDAEKVKPEVAGAFKKR